MVKCSRNPVPFGLYRIGSNFYWPGYHTNCYVHMVELYNLTGEDYSPRGTRHPAAGLRIKKEGVQRFRVPRHAISEKMFQQWYARAKEASRVVMFSGNWKAEIDRVRK